MGAAVSFLGLFRMIGRAVACSWLLGRGISSIEKEESFQRLEGLLVVFEVLTLC